MRSDERLEARLEEAEILRLEDHPQAARLASLAVDFDDRLGDDIHVRLCIHTAGNRQADKL